MMTTKQPTEQTQITIQSVKDIYPLELQEALEKWKRIILTKSFQTNFLKGDNYTWKQLGLEFERLAEYRFLFSMRSRQVEDVRDYIFYKLHKNPVLTIKTLRDDYILDIEPDSTEAYVGKMFKRLLERMARLNIPKFHWEEFTELFPTRFWATPWATPEDYLFAIKPYKDHDLALIKRKDLKAIKITKRKEKAKKELNVKEYTSAQ